MSTRPLTLAVLLIAVPILVPGCGSESDSPPQDPIGPEIPPPAGTGEEEMQDLGRTKALLYNNEGVALAKAGEFAKAITASSLATWP